MPAFDNTAPSNNDSNNSVTTSNASPMLDAAILIRCRNPSFGDFQCNNAIAISQNLKKLSLQSG